MTFIEHFTEGKGILCLFGHGFVLVHRVLLETLGCSSTELSAAPIFPFFDFTWIMSADMASARLLWVLEQAPRSWTPSAGREAGVWLNLSPPTGGGALGNASLLLGPQSGRMGSWISRCHAGSQRFLRPGTLELLRFVLAPPARLRVRLTFRELGTWPCHCLGEYLPVCGWGSGRRLPGEAKLERFPLSLFLLKAFLHGS